MTPRSQEEAKRLTPEVCLCDTVEEGWRACPISLCERDDHAHVSSSAPTRCACKKFCGDVAETDDRPNAVCKGLPIKREPLVEIVLVPRV